MGRPLVKYGFARMHIGEDCYEISPTFINISSLGTPKEIIESFTSFIGETNPVWKYSKALEIVQACCEPELPESITGRFKYTGKSLKMVNPPPSYFINDIIVMAEHCLKHGIVGPVREDGGNGEPLKEFDAYEFIELAVEHLGRSIDDASNMTMTQFVRSMETKFPDIKEKKQARGFTKEELDWHNKMVERDKERAAKAARSN